MRQIVLDTETTGLDPQEGHRIIEIGAIVIQKRQITQETFHTYLNPERDSDTKALAVHGLSTEFLSDKPRFAKIAADFIRFVEGAELIIHNAKFDVGFLNYELQLLNQGFKPLDAYCRITDTIEIAKTKYPGQKYNLDALALRCEVSKTKRGLHGALSDSELLAQVYLHMTGGQDSLFETNVLTSSALTQQAANQNDFNVPLPVYYATDEEMKAHQARLDAIQALSGACLWEQSASLPPE